MPPQPDIPHGKGQVYGEYAGKHLQGVLANNFGDLLPRFWGQIVLLMFWRKSRCGRTKHHVNPFQAETALDFKESLAQIIPNVTILPANSVLDQFLREPHGVET